MATEVSVRPRVAVFDTWRGLIIVVMALDHANGFIAQRKLDSELWTGPYPDYGGDWAAFLTRWVTHLAAPGFFFLLGVGAVLLAHHRAAVGWSRLKIGGHLVARGVLLVVLQFTWENRAWWLDEPQPPFRYVGVLFALGGCLIVAAFLTELGPRILAAGGVALIVLAELTLPDTGWTLYPAWQLLVAWPGPGDGWFSLYPIAPWLGVTLLGMALGRTLRGLQGTAIPIEPRRLGRAGGVALVAFLVLRVLDGFGNIRPAQTDDFIGFLNTVKYPPAITFLLPALGLGAVMVWLLHRSESTVGSFATRTLGVYGRAPLFFYLIHLYLYGFIGVWVGPTSLAVTYGWWAVGLVVLYPACRRFGAQKASRPLDSPLRVV